MSIRPIVVHSYGAVPPARILNPIASTSHEPSSLRNVPATIRRSPRHNRIVLLLLLLLLTNACPLTDEYTSNTSHTQSSCKTDNRPACGPDHTPRNHDTRYCGRTCRFPRRSSSGATGRLGRADVCRNSERDTDGHGCCGSTCSRPYFLGSPQDRSTEYWM